MVIDRSSHLPLYIQLKELFLNYIERGDWKPGQQLPTEEEIQKEYDLSRTTVRQALKELDLDGKIHRQSGKGTFVAQHKIQEGSEAFSLDAINFRDQGLEMTWKVLSAKNEPATDNIAASLNITPGKNIFSLKRIRIANDTIIGYVVSYITDEFIENIDLSLAEKGGTMNYITGIDFSKCTVERVLEALPAGKEEIKMLEMTSGEPILVLTRLLKDSLGRPIELFRGVYRGDRFRYHVQNLPPQV
jgi:GntR family transcriptional regulator